MSGESSPTPEMITSTATPLGVPVLPASNVRYEPAALTPVAYVVVAHNPTPRDGTESR